MINQNKMKVFLAFIAFVIWMFVSLALVLSIVGLFFLVVYEDEWIELGKDLLITFKSE